jgi:acetyl-CoA carboxylase beta subunit
MASLGQDIEARDPGGWPGYAQDLNHARKTMGVRQAVAAATATIRGKSCVIIGFEFSFLGSTA